MAVPQPHRERLLPFAELGQGEAGELIGCCARAASGHAAAAPPSSVMNSRRLMGSSRADPSSKLRLSQEACVVRHSKIARPTSGLGHTRSSGAAGGRTALTLLSGHSLIAS